MARPIAVTFGTQPCCLACFQKLAISGGMNTPMPISQPAFLNVVIWAVKSSVPSWNAPGSVGLRPAGAQTFAQPGRHALPSGATVQWRVAASSRATASV